MNEAMNRFPPRARGFRRGAAWLCLALFLSLQLLAVSAPLHQRIHSDSTAPGHHCAITLLTQGQLSAPDVLAGLGLIFTAGICVPLLCRAVALSSFDYRLCPSRAPPRY